MFTNQHVFLFDWQWSVKKSIVNVQIMGGYDSSICCDDMALMITIPDALCMVYLPTKLGDCWGFYVGKYSSTMEHMGMIWFDELVQGKLFSPETPSIYLPVACRYVLTVNLTLHVTALFTVHDMLRSFAKPSSNASNVVRPQQHTKTWTC